MTSISRREMLLGIAAAALSASAATPKRAMLKKPIPSSGEELPVIGLGTWQTFDVGGTDSARKPLIEVLQTLVAEGGKLVDSSPM